MKDNETELQELQSKIDHLTALVEELRVELHTSKKNKSREESEDDFQPGDKVKILNNYRGEKGRIVKVSRVFKNNVYFTIDGRNSYRYA